MSAPMPTVAATLPQREAILRDLGRLDDAELLGPIFETSVDPEPVPPCRPVAPAADVAAAVESGGRRVWSNAAWEALFGADAPLAASAALAPERTRGPLRYRLLTDRHGEALLAAGADLARGQRWPGIAGAVDVRLEAWPAARVWMCCAPTRTSAYDQAVANAFGLSPPLVETLTWLHRGLDPEDVAEAAGIGLAACRKRIRRLLELVGAARLGDLLARTVRLSTDETISEWSRNEGLRQAVGLTPAEGRLALTLADGLSLPEAAEALGVSLHTVRAQAREVAAKCGLRRLRALPRFVAEAVATVAIAEADEVVLARRADVAAATRILPADGRRQVAIADHGPPGGRPVVVLHGGMGSRRAPPRLRAALQARGFRVIGVDRPGFGLTDPAPDADPFAAAADDLRRVLDGLALDRTDLVSIDGGAPAAMAFAEAWPERVGRGVLITPRPPRVERRGRRPVDAWVRMITGNPELAIRMTDYGRRRVGYAGVRNILMRLFSGHPEDDALFADRAWLDACIAEHLSFAARSVGGLMAEQRAYRSWRPPQLGGSQAWTVVVSPEDPFWPADPSAPAFPGLPHARRLVLEGAGRYLLETRADTIAQALADAA